MLVTDGLSCCQQHNATILTAYIALLQLAHDLFLQSWAVPHAVL